jgi:hypothetical protein
MCQPWLYFCYRFDVSVVNSLTLWIRYVSCHSVFMDDFLVYNDSWIHWHCWFHTLAVIQFSGIISWSTKTQFSLMIYGSAATWCFWQFHVLAMTLFCLSIWCVDHEFIDAVIPLISCHSVFRDDFLVYNDSVFADDLWISSDIVFLKIPCVSHDFMLRCRGRTN